jgi:hypothetical protein
LRVAPMYRHIYSVEAVPRAARKGANGREGWTERTIRRAFEKRKIP